MFCALATYALKKTLLRDINTYEESKLYMKYNGVKVEEMISKITNKSIKYNIKSRHNHTIPIEYILKDNNYDNTTIILVHGHGLDKTALYPIADTISENGMNVVLFDLRLHGKNTAKFVTYGYLEKDDLEDVVNFVKTKMTKENSIGILGQSMGAATTGMYSGTEHAMKNVKFVVLDCPYTSMEDIVDVTGVREGYKLGLIRFLRRLGSIENKILFGFYFSDVDVCKAISTSEIPTLIYCVGNDKTCPYYMADKVFESIKHEKKEKILFDLGGHINGFYKNNDIYIESLLRFIEKYK